MNKLQAYIRLLRPQQYYKNLLIFLGIFFSGNIFELEYYLPLLLGFIGLCSLSSVNYILNDIKDIEKDKKHPEKAIKRPLAVGIISTGQAWITAILLFIFAFILAVVLPIPTTGKILYAIMLATLFISSQLYTWFFKNYALYDVSFIAFNYIWRTIAGVVIIDVYLSPWVFSLAFIFALFLALSKRRGDLVLLGEHASEHKKSFEGYSIELLDQYMAIVSATMILSWIVYITEMPLRIDAPFANLNLPLLTIPLVTMIIFRLLSLIRKDGEFARKAELIFFEKEILVMAVLVGILLFLGIYWDSFPFDQWINDYILSTF